MALETDETKKLYTPQDLCARLGVKPYDSYFMDGDELWGRREPQEGLNVRGYYKILKPNDPFPTDECECGQRRKRHSDLGECPIRDKVQMFSPRSSPVKSLRMKGNKIEVGL